MSLGPRTAAFSPSGHALDTAPPEPGGSEFCVHQPKCVGCGLSALPYPAQLAWKQAQVQRALYGYPELEATLVRVRHTQPADPMIGYRVRAKLVVAGVALGLYAADDHEVVDIPHCKILRPRVAKVVAAVRRSLPLPFELLAIDVREADAGVLLNLIVPPATDVSLLRAAATQLGTEEPLIASVSFSTRAPDSPRVLGDTPELLWGAASLPHRLAPSTPFVAAVSGGFVQAHPAQAERLHALVERTLAERWGKLAGLSIVELYAGSGALALRLAAQGAAVFASDNYAPNIASLEATARAQGIALVGRAESAEQSLSAHGTCHALIVDPPRRGLSPRVRAALGESQAQLLLIVSCEPATLARDLAHLARLGWHAQEITPWDMIPQSRAVEALAVLARGLPSPPAVLFEDDKLVAVDKPPFLPTTPHPEHPTSLLERVRTLPGCQQAVAVHRLDAGTSGVCLFARSPGHVAELSRALANGNKRYAALAEGVTHKRGHIRRPIPDGPKLRPAATRYVRQRVVSGHSLLDVYPEHGRKHQIRRHLAAIGHGLIGDERHGRAPVLRHFQERHGLDRPFLHCASIHLQHADELLELESALPADLCAVLESLEGSATQRRTQPVPKRAAVPRPD